MSELMPKSREAHHSHHEHNGESRRQLHEAERQIEQDAKQSTKHSHEQIKELEHKAETAALSSTEIKIEDRHPDEYQPTQGFPPNREIREMAYSRLLTRARKQLTAPQRLLSNFMHQPIIEAASEATAKTVGRPSGILGGGLLAFIGTASYYYITKNYGYNYNYFVFLALLIGGFTAGWCAEILLKIGTKSK